MLTHWPSRQRSDAMDLERVETFTATSRDLGNVPNRLSKVYNFVWPPDVASSISFLFFEGVSVRHYILHAAVVWGSESDQHLFYNDIKQHNSVEGHST